MAFLKIQLTCPLFYSLLAHLQVHFFFLLSFFVLFFSFPLTSYIYGRRIFLLNMQSLKKIKNKGEYGCDGTLGVRQERTL